MGAEKKKKKNSLSEGKPRDFKIPLIYLEAPSELSVFSLQEFGTRVVERERIKRRIRQMTFVCKRKFFILFFFNTRDMSFVNV